MSACGPLVDQILRRVRDPSGMGITRDKVREVLSWSQQLLVMGFELILSETSLTTLPKQLFYPLPLEVYTVTSVQFQTHDLHERSLRELYLDSHWFRRVSSAYESWTTVGHDLLILFPALDVPSSVTIIHPKITAPLVLDEDPMEVDDADLNEILELTELLLLLRARDLTAAKELVPRFSLHLLQRGIELGPNV